MTGIPAFRSRGEGAETVVFLHGIGGDSSVWTPQLAALSDGRRAVAWDMPGCGESPPPAETSFPALAGSLRALLDHLRLERAHLVGHSLGGMIVQEFAATDPERVRTMVLYGTSPAFGPPDGEWQRAFIASRLGPLDGGAAMPELAPMLVQPMLGDDPDPAGVALATAAMARTRAETYRASMRSLASFDRRDALGRISAPTLVLAAEKDANAPAAMMERMAARIPGARFVVIPGAGHLAHLERPALFNGILAGFLGESARTGS